MICFGSKFYKGRIVFIILLFLLFFTTVYSQIAFLPFKDQSGFKSKWELGIEIPNFLRAFLKEKYEIPTLSPRIIDGYLINKGIDPENFYTLDTWKELANHYKFRFLITGEIVEFKISKFTVGFPLFAGYEAFSCVQVINFRMYDIDNERTILQGELNNSLSDRGLGVTLAGRPTDRNKEYNSIDEMKFGSEEFKKSLFGESSLKISQDFSTQLESYIPVIKANIRADFRTTGDDSISMKKQNIFGQILFFDKERAFINLGSSDGLTPGEKLQVFFPNPQINTISIDEAQLAGVIEVIDVRSQHFSICKIIEGNNKVKEKFIVQKLTIR
jgi:hypothetical protein